MAFTRQQFVEWGSLGGRTRAQRLSKARRKQIAKAAGIAPKRKRGRPVGSTSGSKVDISTALSMYKSGDTLAVIGEHFGVTRERVRQLLEKQGITKVDGGAAITQFKKIPDRILAKKMASEKTERRIQAIWGISAERYKQISAQYGRHCDGASNPFARYVRQRESARQRKIPWEITFADWWSIWEESGKWPLAGRGQGKYVMARWGDCHAYRMGNVKIIPSVENNSDRPQKRSRLPMGVHQHRKKFRAEKMVGGKKYVIGYYQTPELAHEAYLNFQPKRAKK